MRNYKKAAIIFSTLNLGLLLISFYLIQSDNRSIILETDYKIYNKTSLNASNDISLNIQLHGNKAKFDISVKTTHNKNEIYYKILANGRHRYVNEYTHIFTIDSFNGFSGNIPTKAEIFKNELVWNLISHNQKILIIGQHNNIITVLFPFENGQVISFEKI
ncbi:hypothetical protein [Vibrio cholerae]|uniref:hypothetical protein n=1 Tax=Vibrio cholerae TaxID=666 RepID=UPI0022F31805|nr:hypothetical protein [Vibrio cholerae]MDA5313214.1 hypothetical protein [Vibrio cholerae]MDA5316607.1 hypothetical protein [Vibrio cholerae]MDN6972354.1 hypothetical protein [Vibrio cholerae]